MAGLGRGLGALLSASSRSRADKQTQHTAAVLSETARRMNDKAAASAAAVSDPRPDDAEQASRLKAASSEPSVATEQQVGSFAQSAAAGAAAVAEQAVKTEPAATSSNAAPSGVIVSASQYSSADAAGVIRDIPLRSLRASVYQPRTSFNDDSLQELAESIKTHGLLEPLLVSGIRSSKASSDYAGYEIICGERRFRAAKIAGLSSVPCIVRELSDADSYAVALIENIQREDLNVLEIALAYEQMMKACSYTQDALAKAVGKSRSTVANTLRLLKLEPFVSDLLRSGAIDTGHAKVLLALSGNKQVEAAKITAEKNLTVAACSELVKDMLAGKPTKQSGSRGKTASKKRFSSYEKLLNNSLRGVRARFSVTAENSGKLTLSFANAEELESLLSALGLKDESLKSDAAP